MQNAGSLRDKLHQYINVADEQKLHAIYTLLEGEMEHIYSKEDIEMFFTRRERYLAREGESFSVEESINRIRKKS